MGGNCFPPIFLWMFSVRKSIPLQAGTKRAGFYKLIGMMENQAVAGLEMPTTIRYREANQAQINSFSVLKIEKALKIKRFLR